MTPSHSSEKMKMIDSIEGGRVQNRKQRSYKSMKRSGELGLEVIKETVAAANVADLFLFIS